MSERERRPGLGRLPAPDPRDKQYPMRALLPATRSRRTYRYWNSRWIGDQGFTSSCVGFAWVGYLHDGPVTQPGPAPVEDPLDVYRAAQLVDEWPGEEPEMQGTSVRAGAKVLKARGYITEYRWAFTLDDIVEAILEVGPVVVGTVWTEDMFDPDPDGFISATGPVIGGHAYGLNGVNKPLRILRIKQSWGDWGRNGFGYITFDDFSGLLAQDGEACLATEVRVSREG